MKILVGLDRSKRRSLSAGMDRLASGPRRHGFSVYSNDCDDGSDLLLNRLAEHGVLVHETHQPQPDRSIQWSALNAAWKHPLRKAAD